MEKCGLFVIGCADYVCSCAVNIPLQAFLIRGAGNLAKEIPYTAVYNIWRGHHRIIRLILKVPCGKEEISQRTDFFHIGGFSVRDLAIGIVSD